MKSTKDWAASHGICVAETVPPVEDYSKPRKKTASEVAGRTIILHCVAAVGYAVNPIPVVAWLKAQDLWDQVSPQEKNLLSNDALSEIDSSRARWRQEAQWALLWTISKVESLGLPTKTCDTQRLVDEIMPPLGSSVESYIRSAVVRSPSELLAEEDRIYDLHCYARPAFRAGVLPDDLIYEVLYQRHYAFEWLDGKDGWDNVCVDT